MKIPLFTSIFAIGFVGLTFIVSAADPKPGTLQQTFGKPTHVNDNAFHVNSTTNHVNDNAFHVNDRPAPVAAMQAATYQFTVSPKAKIQAGALLDASLADLKVGDIVLVTYHKHGTNMVANLIQNGGAQPGADKSHLQGKVKSIDSQNNILILAPL